MPSSLKYPFYCESKRIIHEDKQNNESWYYSNYQIIQHYFLIAPRRLGS